MKAIKIEDNDSVVLVANKEDRVFVLTGDQCAVIIGSEQKEGDESSTEIKLTSVFPNLKDGDAVPFTATLSACVRVFLDDPEWVMEARKRMEVKEAAAKSDAE